MCTYFLKYSRSAIKSDLERYHSLFVTKNSLILLYSVIYCFKQSVWLKDSRNYCHLWRKWYKVWTKYGVIGNILEKNCLNKTKYNRLKIIDVPQTETSIKTLVLVRNTKGTTVPRDTRLKMWVFPMQISF